MNLNFERQNDEPKYTNNWPDSSELDKYLLPETEGKNYRKFSVPLSVANVLNVAFPKDIYADIPKLQKDFLPLKTFEFKIKGTINPSEMGGDPFIMGLYLVAEPLTIEAAKAINDFLDLKGLGFSVYPSTNNGYPSQFKMNIDL